MRTVFALVVVAMFSGCSSGTAPKDSEAAARDPLVRPLHLPKLAADGECPTSRGRIVDEAYGLAFGPGPVFAAALGKRGTLDFSPPDRFDSAHWGGNKVLWLVGPEYHGPVLIRGGRLDRSGRVRFDEGNVPPARIRLGADPVADGVEPAWRDRPSYTRVEGLGCYAWQIDGRDFSYAIVFRVVAASL